MIINVTPGVSDFYLLESDDGTESFQLDVHCGRRNRTKASFQLRYEREIILARLCTYARELEPLPNLQSALKFFCQQVNLPEPQIQGGIS